MDTEMQTGTGERWEAVEVPTKCTLGELRKAIKSYSDDCLIKFSSDPKLAESMTRIPIRTHVGANHGS